VATINNDKEVLEKGRKSPLKDVDAPKRDQIVDKLADKLRDMEFPKKVVQAWNQANIERQEQLERQETYLQDWDEFLINDASGPWDGSSNLHLPTSFIVAKTYHARFMQALMGIEPPFNMRARREDSVDRVPMVSDTMAYSLKDWGNYYDGVYDAVDEWIWNWVTTGNGFLKLRWDKKFERFLDVQLVPKPRVQVSVDPETGAESHNQVTELVEEEVKVTKTIFDGPVMETRPLERIVLIGSGDPQRADMAIDECELSASEMWTMADQKIFDKDSVEKVIKSGQDPLEGRAHNKIEQQRAQNAGQSMLDTETDLDRYQILETYAAVDVDGSGINTEIVAWIHPKTNELLRATYLRRVNKAGERPIFHSEFYRRPGQKHAIGLLEILHPLSREMDAIHNMRIDNGILSNMPIGFYKASSSLNPEKIAMQPGMLIPLDDPQRDVYFPNMGNKVSFGFQEEAALQTLVERLTGVNDMMTGVMSGSQGAARTATGARGLMAESSSNLDVHLKRLQRTWRRALRYWLHMLQQRVPAGLSFQITGDDGKGYWRYIRGQEDLCGDFDIELDAQSANSNQAIQQENAQVIMQMHQNPIYLQTGVVGLGNLYEGAKNFLKSRGIKDFARYITKPPEYTYLPTPEEEANRILRGQQVPILPNSDHAGFIAYFEEIFQTDEILGQFNQDQAMALYQQYQEHQKALAAIQAAQAQQANSAQMVQNSQQGPLAAAQAQPGLASGDPSGGQQVPQ
jgi:hypothetical protein